MNCNPVYWRSTRPLSRGSSLRGECQQCILPIRYWKFTPGCILDSLMSHVMYVTNQMVTTLTTTGTSIFLTFWETQCWIYLLQLPHYVWERGWFEEPRPTIGKKLQGLQDALLSLHVARQCGTDGYFLTTVRSQSSFLRIVTHQWNILNFYKHNLFVCYF